MAIPDEKNREMICFERSKIGYFIIEQNAKNKWAFPCNRHAVPGKVRVISKQQANVGAKKIGQRRYRNNSLGLIE